MSIASDCDLILQILRENRSLSAHFRGEEPSHLRVVPPGQRSSAIACLEQVFVMLRVYVLAWCLFWFPLVSAVLSVVLSGDLRTAKCWDKTFGVLVLCRVVCPLLSHRGRFPQWGGTCTPRYCSPLGWLSKSAGRPMGPSTLRWQVLRDFAGFVFAFCWVSLGWMLGILFGFLVSGVGMVFGLSPFRTWPLFATMFAVPSFSFSGCLVGFVDAVFSLLFSFSQALGKPKPSWFGFPFVFSSSCTRTPSSTRTSCSTSTPRSGSSHCCFFFSSSSFACLVVVGCVCLVSESLSGWVCFVVFVLSAAACLHMLCIREFVGGSVTMVFFGAWGEDQWPACVLNWSHPPHPLLPNAVKDGPGRGWGTIRRQPYCHAM